MATRTRSLPLVLLALLPLAANAADPAGVHDGAILFATKGCAHCHGANGIGGGLGPDLAHVRDRLTPAQLATQIREGGKAMPAFGDILSSQEVSSLVDYLRSHRQAPPTP
jgi:mono/diheme cytochrome c family protein